MSCEVATNLVSSLDALVPNGIDTRGEQPDYLVRRFAQGHILSSSDKPMLGITISCCRWKRMLWFHKCKCLY